jgi:hypothetical protein
MKTQNGLPIDRAHFWVSTNLIAYLLSRQNNFKILELALND